MIAKPFIPMLSGAPNFSELGGYAAADGRTIRPARIYRSQGLHALTDGDLEALRSLDIRLVCDLRSERERMLHPSRWPHGVAPHHITGNVAVDIRANNRQLIDMMRAAPGPKGAYAMMIASYRLFPATFAAPLTRMFSYMLAERDGEGAGALPMLVHCTAGKDRTGFVIAMILSALGVARDAILADYLQTERRIDRAQMIEATRGAVEALLGFAPDDGALDVIVSVSPDFLQAAFDAIDEQYGNVERYLAVACGLDAAGRARFASLVLQ